MDPHTPPPLAQLLEDCWHLDSTRRPTAAQLVDRLTAIIDGGGLGYAAGDPQRGPSLREREEARRASPVGRREAGRKPKRERLAAPAWLETSDSDADQAQQVWSDFENCAAFPKS